ncbi:MAG: transposase [Pirellulales bacterium]
MARVTRAEVCSHDEIAVVHVMSRVVRRCFLFGTDVHTGKCYNHSRAWVETELKRLAAGFGIDLLAYTILSNHLHLVLRTRPDIVESWDDTEAARRWLNACPIRKGASEPTEPELNSIRNDPVKLKAIRRRLSCISWWMKLLCQRIAQRANKESEEKGVFWSGRFKAVRLLDETSILACAAYVDLNPIRAAMAETLESSCYTSIKTRIESLLQETETKESTEESDASPDRFLAPVQIDEHHDPLGPRPSRTKCRASDKGFLPISRAAYIELLDWTARQVAPGKRGCTPESAPPIFERLEISPETWCSLVGAFGRLFHHVAGKPHMVASARGKLRRRRFRISPEAQAIFESSADPPIA